MLSKAQIKILRSLHLNKYRRKYRQFLAEGTVNVLDFIAGPLSVIQIYATESWIEKHPDLPQHIKPETISSKEMEKISALKNPSDVLAVIEKPEHQLPDISTLEDYVLALDNIKDPGNLGTIIRTADWFGIKEILCSDETVDAYNPKVVQATMGSLARVRVHYTNLSSWLSKKPSRLKIFGAVLNGQDIRKVKKPGKGILLIGSEAHGISDSLFPFIDEPVSIPAATGSQAESLNAAVATGIVCYTFRMTS
jgi:TrmH family RNA methyltransferase